MQCTTYFAHLEKHHSKYDQFFVRPLFAVSSSDYIEKVLNSEELFPNVGTIKIFEDKYEIVPTQTKLQNLGEFCIVDTKNKFENDKYAGLDRSVYYIVYSRAVSSLKDTNFIEILPYNGSIETMAQDSSKHILYCKFKPINTNIFLESNNMLYGPFEWKAEFDNDNVDTSLYCLKLYAPEKNNYIIKEYKKENFLPYILSFTLEAYNGEERKFIYREPDSIQSNKEIDFIDNADLKAFFINAIKKSKEREFTRNEINYIKSALEGITDLPKGYLARRKEQLLKAIDFSNESLEFRSTVLSHMLSDEAMCKAITEQIRESYSNDVMKMLKDTPEYKKLEEKKKQIEDVIKSKENELEEYTTQLEQKRREIENETNEKLSTKREELKNLSEVVERKSSEFEFIQKKLNLYYDYEDLVAKTKELDEQYSQLESQIAKTKIEFEHDIKERIARILVDGYVADAVFKAIDKHNNDTSNTPHFNYHEMHLNTSFTAEQVIDRVQDYLCNKAHRNYTRNDIINFLLCMTHGFVTIFAGEPGTGKTSLCALLAKSLGLYGEGNLKRYIEVSVERGWTSRKDLIGYYNPLTKSVEKSNIDLYNCLCTITEEFETGKQNIPFFVLLDEANLSPIEHYWADFMRITDNDGNRTREVNLGDQIKFKITDSLRFLATMNYDHTTEMLSPRFLDRSWIVLVQPSGGVEIADIGDESNSSNAQDIIDFSCLNKHFNLDIRDEQLPSHLEKKLKSIWEIFNKGANYVISPRSLKMVRRYCYAAQKYMDTSAADNRFDPLDYAVAQKILPLINGHGESYKTLLENLKFECENGQMKKCKTILDKMLKTGERDMGYYQFFTR